MFGPYLLPFTYGEAQRSMTDFQSFVPQPTTFPSARIEAFLNTCKTSTPFVVVDIDIVEFQYRELCRVLPNVDHHYAVKANPAVPILQRLHSLGCSFDIASRAELNECLSIGVDPENISYGNTIKKSSDISFALAKGVRRFTVDSSEELNKIFAAAQLHQPEPIPAKELTITIRLLHAGSGADWPLSKKFGTSQAQCTELMKVAHQHECPVGVAFHVGSQQRDIHAWDSALETVASINSNLLRHGSTLDHINLGGGFPGHYQEEIPSIDDYGAAIMHSLEKFFGMHRPKIFAEPGRYLVADAGVLRSSVVLVSQREIDPRRWVFIDCGRFHGLVETFDEAIHFRLRTNATGQPIPSVLAGPTCDSIDVMYEQNPVDLPANLVEGDSIDFLAAGAYTAPCSSVGFNGMPPLNEIFLD